jgi:hypothetical protein
MPTMLSSAKASVDRFLKEARCCAICEHGFAAMLTAFSVLLAVQEAIEGSSATDAKLFADFVPTMTAKAAWFHSPSTTATDSDISTALIELRNALAHELSMPDRVKLANNAAEVGQVRRQWLDANIIAVWEFVDDVWVTVHSLIATHPGVVMDPSQSARRLTMPRDVADRAVLPDGTSASSVR